MSLVRLQYTLIAGWFMALLLVFGVRFALGAPALLSPGLGMVLLACIPPAVLLVVFRGAAPPDTIAEVLYADAQRPAIAPATQPRVGPPPASGGR